MLDSTKSWQAADHVGASASIYRIREQSATLDRCAHCRNKTERLPLSDLENTAKCVARRGSVLQCSLCKADRLDAVINLDRARARSTSLRQAIDGKAAADTFDALEVCGHLALSSDLERYYEVAARTAHALRYSARGDLTSAVDGCLGHRGVPHPPVETTNFAVKEANEFVLIWQ
ncbi:hypothetical protein AK812_SmicGene35272 [Symbiodinium microadriaticum]|uniref:Uncharacterized protein n=1 Tax=Symbiodinium microadriaticum TaxID=2951 RepID=A0A1Q9CLV6_SYMMI|nr:hypothetical protein AK812_SmicGene35272 [Symbiodinium microadriaticum]